MSIHVCQCQHNGRTEHHLRYPGMSQSEAQELADKINGGRLPITTAQRHIKAIKDRCGSVVLSMHCDKALEALDMAPQPIDPLITRILAHLDARAVGWNEAKGEFKPYEFGAQHEARALAAQVRELIASNDPTKPCRSPYCECDPGQCTHPGFHDARGEAIPQRVITCVYCGHQYPAGTPSSGADNAALTEHIKACEKHPMRQLEADKAGLMAIVNRLAWPDDGETLTLDDYRQIARNYLINPE